MATLDERATVVSTARGDVQVAMAGEGPPVLVSHGAPGGFDLGLAWCDHLREAGCRLIAVSRPGYLRTPLESGTSVDQQADLYAALLDAVDVERATVYGFSAGAPSAVHFAARHPARTVALVLDAGILQPFRPPTTAVQRASIESGFLVWLWYQVAQVLPRQIASFSVHGMSHGLSPEQRQAAVDWITSDPSRLRRLQDEAGCTAPRKLREPGWINDQANEANLAPLPFADVGVPTLIAHGTHDSVVPVEHATHAAAQIPGAELMLVEQGHHALSLSRNFEAVAARQRELALSAAFHR